MRAIDYHVGAVGAGIMPGTLVKVMGTSICDILVGTYAGVGDKAVHDIYGQVDGTVLSGYVGFEAGQAAFGAIYAWFKHLMYWPIQHVANADAALEDQIFGELTVQAAQLPLTERDPVALDWHNGRRTPDADSRVQGAIEGVDARHNCPGAVQGIG